VCVDFHVSDEVSEILGRAKVTRFHVHYECMYIYISEIDVLMHLTLERFLYITLKAVSIKTPLSYRILNEFSAFL
jgi:hypothetical protein